MTNITPEIETEAATWAEGTKYTAADILRAYREHLGMAAEPLDIQRFCETVLGIDPAGGQPPASVEVAVRVCHRSSIAGARWCQPVGWSPRNRIEGADWDDGDGVWNDENGEAAGIVVFGHDAEGDTVTVGLDDLRVVSSGDCRVIGEVEIDFA